MIGRLRSITGDKLGMRPKPSFKGMNDGKYIQIDLSKQTGNENLNYSVEKYN